MIWFGYYWDLLGIVLYFELKWCGVKFVKKKKKWILINYLMIIFKINVILGMIWIVVVCFNLVFLFWYKMFNYI